MSVPLFDFKTQTQSLQGQLREAFERVLSSGQFINGPEVERLEKSLGAYLSNHTAGALGVSSGTDALLVALMAYGIGPGDEVLLPSFTFFATAGAVARLGAKPVFVDIDPLTFNISPDDLVQKYSRACKAVIPVHLFGQSADMNLIMAFAEAKDMVVIEDVAQAIGGKLEGKQLGTIGDCGAFSFFPTKNIGALGDAGAVCAKDPKVLLKMKQLRNHGDVSRYEHLYVGGNFRLDALQAAFLNEKFGLLDALIERRRVNAKAYLELLKGLGEIVLPKESENCYHTYNQFTIRVLNGKRDSLKEHLTAKGIGTQVYYPIPLHKQKCFAAPVSETRNKRKNFSSECPETDKACAEVLSLPIYPELASSQLEEVAAAVKSFFK